MSWNPVTAIATAGLATMAVVLICVLLASPAAAQCGGKPIPPGNSEVDQYQEAIPGNCGETEPGEGGGGGGSVPTGTSDQLEALGEDGAAVADLVDSTGTNGAGEGSGSGGVNGGEAGSDAASVAAEAGEGSAVSAAIRGLAGDSDDGLGIALPLLLAALAAAAIAAVAIRRRRA